jgi:hypothetical protein
LDIRASRLGERELHEVDGLRIGGGGLQGGLPRRFLRRADWRNSEDWQT